MSINNRTELTKLEEMLNKQYAYNFDAEEVEVLKRVVNLMRGFDAFGSLAGFIQRSIVWFGAVVGAYISIKSGAAEYILSVIRG